MGVYSALDNIRKGMESRERNYQLYKKDLKRRGKKLPKSLYSVNPYRKIGGKTRSTQR